MSERAPIICGLVLSAIVFAGDASAQQAGLAAALRDGTPTFELRGRYEAASQAGTADADALTLRARLGWQTATWRDFQAAIEFDHIAALSGDYNDGVPPAEPYAVIADPDVTELNRLQIAWTPNETITATLGRQRITLDDQRFIGASGWRQDDQTFDALRVDLRRGALQASYAYLDHVNRVFAEDLDWDSQSHIFNVSYAFDASLKLTGFAYLLDFETAGAAQSNATYGLRAIGERETGALKWTYSASYAVQSDHGANPVNYDAEYWSLDLGAAHGPFTARIGYESLEGNGPNQRFITPLATLHAFQGWADVFLSTPNDGIDDAFISGAYRLPAEAPVAANGTLTVTWHEYEAERTGADLGEELNIQFSGQITRAFGFVAKYAEYEGPGAPADSERIWFGLEYKL